MLSDRLTSARRPQCPLCRQRHRMLDAAMRCTGRSGQHVTTADHPAARYVLRLVQDLQQR